MNVTCKVRFIGMILAHSNKIGLVLTLYLNDLISEKKKILIHPNTCDSLRVLCLTRVPYLITKLLSKSLSF